MKTSTTSTAAGNQNVLLIGAGPHAQKVYLPWFVRNGETLKAQMVGIVELEAKAKSVAAHVESLGISPEIITTRPFENNQLPNELKDKLTQLVKTRHVTSVIIATEPSAHKPYAIWALRNGLSILMDKPITARKGSRTDKKAAEALITDYEDLMKEYREAQKKNPHIIFSVGSQRRYHYGFNKVREKIQDVLERTNCPVTSIQSSHSDGQWRLPQELVDIDYHGFTMGYGKVSHSGYHFFDLIAQLVNYSTTKTKTPDEVEVSSVLTTPVDYLAQLNIKDYSQFFEGYSSPYTQEVLEKKVEDYGEVNAFILMNFLKDKKIISNAQLTLLHNSFSGRSWLTPNADLYKGNGRIKHEQHTIQQGPFQTIQVHSYQLRTTPSTVSKSLDYEIGGRNHLDIYIFRNSQIVGGKDFEKISINQVVPNPDNFDLLTEVVKASMIEEFFEYLSGKIERSQMRSDLSSHGNTVRLMAGTYLSDIRRQQGKNPIVRKKWDS